MGWSIGYDEAHHRDVGYGVPAYCDHPDCNAEIDRGIAHVCGGQPFGGEDGCGLFFCGAHLLGPYQQCERCFHDKVPFNPKPDHFTWVTWKLTDRSWEQWRKENPEAVAAMKAALESKA